MLENDWQLQNKSQLRAELLAKRKDLSLAEVEESSKRICGHLQRLVVKNGYKTIMTYLAYGNEVNLQSFNQFCHKQGLQLVVPVIDQELAGIMTGGLYLSEDQNNLTQTPFGVWEPQELRPLNLQTIDFVLVPGVAFDGLGGRMGHGKGYYDRFLPKLSKNAKTVGICYSFQILKSLPLEPWDFKLEGLCTPAGVMFHQKTE